jgi:uncharacterized protein YndB with AHSA1/START domain
MKKNKLFYLVMMVSLLGCFQSRAFVTDSSFYGFTIRHDLMLNGTPDIVFRALVMDIGKWWDSKHTYSGNAANLSISAKAGGCFCEKLDNGGSVMHMTVVFADPGKTLRMTGGLGPLQALAVYGVMTISLAPIETGTKITVTYVVGGYGASGLSALPGLVDRVLEEQLNRFKAFINKTGE